MREWFLLAAAGIALSFALGCDDGGAAAGGGPCECAGGAACDAAGECPDAGPGGEACELTADCPDGLVCEGGVCQASCATGGNCQEPAHCTAEGLCRNVCEGDASCPDGFACVDKACDPDACRLDGSDCAGDETCDPDTRRCGGEPPPPPVEVSCCAEDGGCAVAESEAACVDGGGAPSGADSCDPNPCDQPPPPRCEADADCDAGRWCALDSGECRAGCRTEADCDAGDLCNDQHRCELFQCEADADCAEGEYCLAQQGTCLAACEDDALCPPGFFCQEGRCTNDCRDTPETEPNDDAAHADALVLGDAGAAQGPDGRLCPLNTDWAAASILQPGEHLRVRLACPNGQADLALALYDEAGNAVARSNEAGCDERLEYPEAGQEITGRFFIEVSGAAPQEGVDYTLDVELLAPVAACDADAGEPDAVDTATRLELPARVAERNICPADVDWYSLGLGRGDGVTIDLTVIAGGGMEELLTFDLSGPGMPAPDFDPTDAGVLHPNETVVGAGGEEILRLNLPVNNQFLRDGLWALRVRGEDERQSAQYTLDVRVTRSEMACPVDPYEPNEGPGAATDLMGIEGFAEGPELASGRPLSLTGLSRCDDDEDWYAFPAAAGDRVSARLTVRDSAGVAAPASGAIHVAIVDADGQISGAEGRDVGPEINGRSGALSAGRHFIRVRGARDARALGYDLEVIRAPGDAPCVDDPLEGAGRNDRQQDAAQLAVGHDAPAVVPGLSLCNANAPNGADVDWFTFTLPEPGRLEVALTFALRGGDGDLDAELFRQGDASGAVAEDLEIHDDAMVVLAHAPADTYFLRVSSFGGEENVYDLRASFTLDQACEPDPQEPNDARGEATEAGAGYSEAGLWICARPEDRDWYRVEVPPNTTYTFHLSYFLDDDGWITFDAYDANGAYVGTVEQNLNAQCLVIDGTPGGETWYFAVQANSFDPGDGSPDRVAYDVDVQEGDRCAALEPLLAGVEWPHSGGL